MTEKRILVVDDDHQVRSQLWTLLSLRGCQVETAANGAKALETLELIEPTFLLLDMGSPDTDGWALVRDMKERQIDVPVIVMGPESQARHWAEEIGAAGFLTKPIHVSSLLACVKIPDQDDADAA